MNHNKLIAEFMYTDGFEHPKVDGSLPFGDYNDSWDWLMPVVQKIESLGYVFTIQGGKAEFGEMVSKPKCFIVTDKISSTYKAVVEFIKETEQ